MAITLFEMEEIIRRRLRRCLSLGIKASSEQQDEEALMLLLYIVSDDEIVGGIGELMAKQGAELK